METSIQHVSPLSLQQTRLWECYQHNPAYHAVSVFNVDGPVVIEVLRQAVQLVVAQHEILRTVFSSLPGMDMPMQMVVEPQFGWEETSLKHLHFIDQRLFIDALLQRLRTTPFDIAQAPCLRAHVLTLNEDASLLVLCLAPFCADTTTLHLLMNEIGSAYAVSLANQELSEEPLQYIDVSAWQNELLQEEDAEEHRLFWRHIDPTAFDVARVPGAKHVQDGEMLPAMCQIPLKSSVVAILEDLAENLQVPSEHIVLTAWQLFLALLTNQEEIVVGVGYDGRHYEDLKSALGLYTRFLPLPISIVPETSFAQLIEQVSKISNKASEDQHYFTWDICGKEHIRRLPTQFLYVQWPDSVESANICFSLKRCYNCIEPFVLKLEAIQYSESYQLNLHFDLNRLTQQSAEVLATSFNILLQSALIRPKVPVKTLRLLLPWQEVQLRKQFRGPHIDFSGFHLIDLFEQQVHVMPEARAVVHNDSVLSYRELNIRANRLANRLRAQGVSHNNLVGLCVSRSVDMIVGLLAILKAGAAYVPLDPQLPVSRLLYQLKDTEAQVLVTQEALQDLFVDYTGAVLCLDAVQEASASVSEENLRIPVSLSDLAYVIYTSGSTGQPKGVLIQHKNIDNYIQSLSLKLEWESGWQFATVSTLAADLGNTTIFGSLITGGCLHILDYETVTSAQRWRRYLQSNPIDVLKIVPSHLSALLASEADAGLASLLLPRRQLILGGESLNSGLLTRLTQIGAPCEIINHYGPTETTIGALFNRLGYVREEWQQPGEGIISIGKPINNVEVVILNAGGHIVPIGVAGELYIAGAGVAQGYLHQPEQSVAKFIKKAWTESETVRYYRTGDLAKYQSDGTIQFIGRADTQVKIRGYRVELGEIEQVLCQHEQVQESVVLLREDQPGEQHLVAYVVGLYAVTPSEQDIKAFLQERLPAYMLPARILCLDALPLTINGKIDRKRLPRPEQVGQVPYDTQDRPYMRPRDDVEARLATIWEHILNLHQIGVRDNFFDLGGNSIIAVRLMSLIHQEFGCDLPLSSLFKAPTLESLATILRQQVPDASSSVVVPLQTAGENTPFFCVHPSGGTVFRYQAFARSLGSEQPFYGLQAPEWQQGKISLEEIAAQYVSAIRSVQPYGPYQIGGWSLGGVIAFEVAQQLKRQGESILLLALIDSSVPPVVGQTEAHDDQELELDDARVSALLQEEGFFTLSQAENKLHKASDQLILAWEQAKHAGRIPTDTGFEQFRRVAYMNCRNLLAVKYYQPAVYDGAIAFFRSSEVRDLIDQAGATDAAKPEMSLTGGWERLSLNEIEVYVVPGKHNEMVDEPYVQGLAQLLKTLLKKNTHLVQVI